MGFWRQFSALMWKNAKVQQRSPWFTLFEVVPPILYTILMVLIGTLFRRTLTTVARYENYDFQFPSGTSPGNYLHGSLRSKYSCLYQLQDQHFTIAYAPKSKAVERLLDDMVKDLIGPTQRTILELKGFESAAEMERAVVSDLKKCPSIPHITPKNKDDKTYVEKNKKCQQSDWLAAIDFTKTDLQSNQLSYTIRFPNVFIGQAEVDRVKEKMAGRLCQPWETGYANDRKFDVPKDNSYWPNYFSTVTYAGTDKYMRPTDYYAMSFIALQHAVDRAFIKSKLVDPAALDNLDKLNVHAVPIPVPKWAIPKENKSISDVTSSLKYLMVIMIVVCYFMSFLWIVRAVVVEKTNHVKDYMTAMGMSRASYWLSHYLFELIKLSLIIIIVAICTRYFKVFGTTILEQTNVMLLMLTLFLFVSCLIANALFVSSFFETGGQAAAASFFFVLINLILSLVMGSTREPFGAGQFFYYTLLMIFPFVQSINALLTGDLQGKPVTFGSLFDDPTDATPVGAIMLLMVLQTIVFMMLTCYMDIVRPGGEAPGEHFLFFLKPRYWCPPKPTIAAQIISTETDPSSPQKNSKLESLQPSPGNTVLPSIEIKHLCKEFHFGLIKKRTLRAVNDFCLSVMPNQLTVLLGHNGAGKSTTFGILTGMMKATSGTATVAGYDLYTQRDQIRKLMGFCPQYNVMYPKLTVLDHLKFFCRLKGCKPDKAEIDELLTKLTLTAHRDVKACRLSGGLKRKLSVGIALIGRSSIVLLDEPSSGLDAQTRHQFWDLLLQERRQRTILLTTHYMEEADVLGDRIAIMAHGKVHCAGTSMFLKARYGAGYYLTVDYVVPNRPDLQYGTLNLIQSHCKEVKQDLSAPGNGSSATFLLPKDARPQFTAMFSHLDEHRAPLGIQSYGVSMTTMDEVFVKAGEEADAQFEAVADGSVDFKRPAMQQTFDPQDLCPEHRITGTALFWQQLRALLAKRLHLLGSNFRITLFLMVLYTCLCLAVMIWAKSVSTEAYDKIVAGGSKPLPLTMKMYGNGQKVFSFRDTFNPTLKDLAESYARSTNADSYSTNDWYNKVAGTYNNKFGRMNNKKGWSPHSLPVSVSVLDTAILQWLTNDPSASITTINHPLPAINRQQGVTLEFGKYWANIGVFYLFIILAFMEITARFGMPLATERELGMKHLQMSAGVSASTYWLSNALFDTTQLLVLVVLTFILLAISGIKEYLRAGVPAYLVAIFLMYIFAILPKRYVMSHSVSEGTLFMISYGVDVGCASIISPYYTLIISVFETFRVSTVQLVCEEARKPIKSQYFDKMSRVVQIFVGNTVCSGVRLVEDGLVLPDYGKMDDGLSNSLARTIIPLLAVLFVSCSACALGAHETRKKQHAFQPEPLHPGLVPPEVMAEQLRAQNIAPTEVAVLAKSLYKSYGDKMVVRGVSFGVNKGECFGLLGVNGAGKTTLFKMLTGEHDIDEGTAHLDGLSVNDDWLKACSHSGYCPQFDAVPGSMNTYALLRLFARLRAVPPDQVNRIVERVIDAVNVKVYADRPFKGYSGGTKRRVSLAVSIVGAPHILLLDEPSSGVDPVSRRALWSVLNHMKQHDSSILLTSHSMEECDVLCGRVAIMANGRLACIGSPLYLKSKFGSGYKLQIQLTKNAENTDAVKELVAKALPTAILLVGDENSLAYQIPFHPLLNWTKLFGIMESLFQQRVADKPKLFDDYYLSQATLEDVFIAFSTGMAIHNANQAAAQLPIQTPLSSPPITNPSSPPIQSPPVTESNGSGVTGQGSGGSSKSARTQSTSTSSKSGSMKHSDATQSLQLTSDSSGTKDEKEEMKK